MRSDEPGRKATALGAEPSYERNINGNARRPSPAVQGGPYAHALAGPQPEKNTHDCAPQRNTYHGSRYGTPLCVRDHQVKAEWLVDRLSLPFSLASAVGLRGGEGHNGGLRGLGCAGLPKRL